MDSCLQATELEPGLLRYAELLQGVLWGGQHNMSPGPRATPSQAVCPMPTLPVIFWISFL